ncbi:MAG: DUF4838 domain-containing protein [Lentisphaeria bacterium]|nr:DUF4838 domain-containing protein [Lentisphaeria bacterium]
MHAKLKFSVILTFCILHLLTLPGAVITGKSVIVADKLSTAPEKTGAALLADTLSRIFKTQIRIIDKKEYDGKSPAVILSSAPMKFEEWCIESLSEKVVRISGTAPRGLLYGITEFLELFGNCRYFDVGVLDIPESSSITVPHGRKFRRAPAFSYRINTGGFWAHDGMARRRIWNKQNGGYAFLGDKSVDAEEGKTLYEYREQRIIGPSCHSFYYWSRNFPEDKKEYFSLNRSGQYERAVSSAGPGQICLSHPEVRRLVKKNILAEIAQSNAHADKKGIPRSFLIDLSHNDNGSFCVCASCSRLLAKYRTYSGVMLDFVNDIASAAPHITFQTFAYTFTEEPPQNIKPASNVMIRIALLGHELMNGPCDTMRPISSASNRKTRQIYEAWSSLTPNLSVWLYHRRFARLFAVPAANFWYMAENFRYFKKLGVKRVNIESEFNDLRNMPFPNSFYALHIYLSEKLMDDPFQDDRKLINDFMDRFYGPAASEMKAFSAYLKKRTEEEKRPLGSVPEHDLVYLDTDFLITINTYINAAMKKTAGMPELQTRIELEYIPLDFAILNMWERLPDLEKKLKMSKNAVFDRLEKALENAFQKYFVPEHYNGKRLAETRRVVQTLLNDLRNPVPAPPELSHRALRQFSAGTMQDAAGTVVNDPEALRGKAQYLGLTHPRHPKFNSQLHTKPMEIGIYDYSIRTHRLRKLFKHEEIHGDGKYHLYYIGRTRIPAPSAKPRLYGHWTWAFNASSAMRSTYQAQDDKALYDFFVSLKFKGPAYVKGSGDPDGIWFDRVIFAKVPPESSPLFSGKKHFIFRTKEFRLSTKKQKLSQDFSAPSIEICRIPLKDGRIEFCFYSYKLRKHLWRKFIAPEPGKKEKWNWYYINTVQIPSAAEKIEFAVHSDWFVMPTPVFSKLRKENSHTGSWKIFARMKFEGERVLLDSIAFSAEKNQCSEKN